jgi:metallophosphoesterase superfamily enzyme
VPDGLVEIIGHHHPAVSCGDGAGSRVKCPALVAGPKRLILPAFSPWAAGATWNEQLGENETLWVIAPARVFALPRSAPHQTAALS